MIDNLQDYFGSELQIFLDSISYNRIENDTNSSRGKISLICRDDINVLLNDNGVRIIIKRTLTLDPKTFFALGVSFGADLRFNSRKNEHDWSEINLAEEFRKNGGFVTDQLMSRISLLIGQITAASGQQPILLPPTVIKENQSQEE